MNVLATAALAILATRPAAAATPAPLGPRAVIRRYIEALRAYRAPPNASFTYTVEQDGPRAIDQTHRIYRSGNNERDELIALEGHPVAHPVVTIRHGRSDRYAVTALAPRPINYRFTFEGAEPVGRRLTYRFRTDAKNPSAYSVTSVVIDGTRFLPLSLTFRARRGRTVANGSVRFATSDRYWVPVSVRVATNAGAQPIHERIAWSSYRFPLALPRGTFSVPRAITSPTPAAS